MMIEPQLNVPRDTTEARVVILSRYVRRIKRTMQTVNSLTGTQRMYIHIFVLYFRPFHDADTVANCAESSFKHASNCKYIHHSFFSNNK